VSAPLCLQRRAPCPCGSGQRLATCCLPWEEAFQRLVGRLLSFAALPRIRRHEATAATLFWDIQGAVRPGKGLGPQGGLRFLEWFLHDYSPGRGEGTLLAGFADAAAGLGPPEEHLLLASLLAPVRAYEVTDTPGSRILVTDLLTGGQRLVGPLGLPGPRIRSDILICRLLPLGRLVRPGAGLLLLPAACREELLVYLRSAYRVARPARHISLEDFLDGSCHLYHHFFLVRGRNLGGLAEETLRFDPFAPGRMIYRADDFSRILAALGRYPELERDEAEGDEVRYACVDIERTVTRATLRLRAGEVELRADSREDLAAARGFLETALRGLIHPVEEQVTDPADSFSKETRRPGSGILGESFLAQYMDRWAETPSPVLDHRTPRDAMRFRAGRQRVVSLLADLERDMSRQKRLGRGWVDITSLREQLGLVSGPREGDRKVR
jgi:SEC-C motif